MKTVKSWRTSVCVVLCAMLFHSICNAEDAISSYSELLKQIGNTLSDNPTGRPLPLATDCWQFRPLKKEFEQKEAVPFLIQVIQQGPDWQDEYKGKIRLTPHVARGYAALCLAYTRDERAFPVLIELLEKGKPLIDINTLHNEIIEEQKRLDELYHPMVSRGGSAIPPLNSSEAGTLMKELQQDYDIRTFAAASLGILKDTRAVSALVKTLKDQNEMVRYHSVLALAEIPDMRTIEPILQAATMYKIDDIAVSRAMKKMTKYRLNIEFNSVNNIVTIPDYPELGIVQYEEGKSKYVFREIWSRWYQNGKSLLEKKYKEKYDEYIKTKKDPSQLEETRSRTRQDIVSLGVPALPMIIQKIEQGETDLVPVVAVLTNNEISKDANQTEVLQWWKENKERWIIFKEEQSTASTEAKAA
ncbi:MAG TPA: HEAT repeat domain-containing protein [Anaerohalosphaeraceae bacterium]|nr:HEAT repeat domain-containing protein [Anaerohalosphaeraceae bacterium]